MIPLKDNNPTTHFPIFTILIILINCAVFIYTDILGLATKEFYYQFSVIPIDISSLGQATERSALAALSTLITSQFLHGGLFHIASNMLFLWIFGNNVEDRLGRIRFVIFYLLCGIIAGLAQVTGDPSSTTPMLGASGAIAGVMGAYLFMFPGTQVLTLIWIVIFIRLVWLPASFIIIYWILIQVVLQVTSAGQQGGVAYLAHIGGFAGGIALYFLFRMFGRR
ncbi:MAG TPA: rhomboid family intramembrane serine protease [candidate division Zixibacteria bacterium]|nr:rhomboid family intramembrane serine protease [candidate division Zixibacteria bacterium]HBY99776.1 rhomboid family intramembrane serine protease [candidate division Zixibacteria bacterium]